MKIYNLKGNEFKIVNFIAKNEGKRISCRDMQDFIKVNERAIRENISHLERMYVLTVDRRERVNSYYINDERDWRV